MNIKTYIDYFPQITKLPREQQFDLLAAAKIAAEQKLFLKSFDNFSLFIRAITLLIFVATSFWLWGSSIVSIVISAIISLIVSRVIIKEKVEKMIKLELNRLIEST